MPEIRGNATLSILGPEGWEEVGRVWIRPEDLKQGDVVPWGSGVAQVGPDPGRPSPWMRPFRQDFSAEELREAGPGFRVQIPSCEDDR